MAAGITAPTHSKKHPINSTKDHKPVAGATGNNIVVIDPATGLPIKDSGTSLSSIISGISIIGEWDAATNTPILASGIGVTGNGYIVSVAGTTNLDGITDWKVKDIAWFDGVASVWRKIDNTEPTHDELLGVTANQHHYKDTFTRQSNFYFVSIDKGNDTNDGSLFNQKKTIDSAILKGTSDGFGITSSIIIILDTSSIGEDAYSAIITAGKIVSIMSLEIEPTIPINITIEEASVLYTNNLNITKIKEAAGITDASVQIHGGILGTIENSIGAFPTNTNVIVNNAKGNSAASLTSILNAKSYKGTFIDYLGLLHTLNGLNANGKTIDNVSDPSTGQQADTKNARDTAIAAITPASIGAEPADATIMKEGENLSLLNNNSNYQSGTQVDGKISTHSGLPNAHHNQLHGGTHVDGTDDVPLATPDPAGTKGLINPTDLLSLNLNTTHRTSDGKDHNDVILNNAHRVDTTNPHQTTLEKARTQNNTMTAGLDPIITTDSGTDYVLADETSVSGNPPIYCYMFVKFHGHFATPPGSITLSNIAYTNCGAATITKITASGFVLRIDQGSSGAYVECEFDWSA